MPAQLVGVQMSLGVSSFVSYKVRLLLAVMDAKPAKFVMCCSHYRNVIVTDNFFMKSFHRSKSLSATYVCKLPVDIQLNRKCIDLVIIKEQQKE